MNKEGQPRITNLKRKGLAAVAAGTLAFSPTVASAESNSTVPQTSGREQQAAAPRPIKSDIWAGYYAGDLNQANSDRASVGATWKMPKAINCEDKIHTQAAIWVGLGGTENKKAELEQIGTTVDCEFGKEKYRGVYQMFNRPGWGSAKKLSERNYPIKPNDKMRAAVGYYKSVDANGKEVGNYDLILRNETRNWYFSSHEVGTTKKTAHNTAEWIVEAPTVQAPITDPKRTALELTKFSKIVFSDCLADGKSISSWKNREIELRLPKGDNTHKALPSHLRKQGKEFIVTWNK